MAFWAGTVRRIERKLATERFLSKLREVENFCPVDTEAGRKDVAIGFVTSSRHVALMMLAAKSFYHFSGLLCPLYVWDDGSLSSSDRNHIRRSFPSAHILRRSELNTDMLARCPLTFQFARQELRNYGSYAPSLKIFGPLASPGAPERFILSDSDAFFFDWPKAIVDWLAEPNTTSRYIAPWSGHDNVPEEDLQSLYSRLGISSCPRINSGLLLLHRSIFNLEILEQVLEWYQSRSYAWDIEQTIYRIWMATSTSAPLNQDEYVLCHRKFNATCHHFFTSVILDEAVVRAKILNLLEYIRDCERRQKPPVVAAERLTSAGCSMTPHKELAGRWDAPQ